MDRCVDLELAPESQKHQLARKLEDMRDALNDIALFLEEEEPPPDWSLPEGDNGWFDRRNALIARAKTVLEDS